MSTQFSVLVPVILAIFATNSATAQTRVETQARIPERIDGPQLDERVIDRESLERARPSLRNPQLVYASARYLNRLTVRDETAIRASSIEFTLFANGESGAEVKCWDGEAPTVFLAPACNDNATCIAKTNRMSSMLLSARLAGRPVTVGHEACVVFEVSLN